MVLDVSAGDAAAFVGLLVGIVEVLKRLMPFVHWRRWGPAVSLVLGLVFSIGVHYWGGGWNGSLWSAVIIGIGLGLAATGLYDGLDRLIVNRRKGVRNGQSTDRGRASSR